MTRSTQIFSAVAVAALAAALIAVRPATASTASSSLAVTAGVTKNCVLTAGTVAFGNYDPVDVNASTPLDRTGTFTVACTKNTAYTVALDLGANASGSTRRMTSGGGSPDFLSYELYLDAAHNTIWNSTNTSGGTTSNVFAITLTVYGRVTAGQNVGAGSYTDTVVSTVNF
jgi:spore coat protein U-like protein